METKKYRKKPVVIEAYQTDKEMIIPTLEGDMHASVGDYIITGVNGEQYPCKPDIFEKTYEVVHEPTRTFCLKDMEIKAYPVTEEFTADSKNHLGVGVMITIDSGEEYSIDVGDYIVVDGEGNPVMIFSKDQFDALFTEKIIAL